MVDQASSGAAARVPLRSVVSGVSLFAVALGVVGAALVGLDVVTRPPCEPGYTRIIDLEPVGAFVSLLLAGAALVVFWRSRRGCHLKTLAGVSVVVLLCAAFVDIGAVATLVHHHGARYDSGCWTF